MRVVIGTSVRSRLRQHHWGDTHFARDVAAGLQEHGWETRIARYSELKRLRPRKKTVVLYLRGLQPTPVIPSPVATWLISHPAEYTADEHGRSQAFFSASQALADDLGGQFLPQATNASRFRPAEDNGTGESVLFVGNSRGQARPCIAHARALGEHVAVYGQGWQKVFPSLELAGGGVANDELFRFYSSAGVVLNDHWPDMAEAGIVSNRIYDALACGAQVLTDRVAQLPAELAEFITIFGDQDSFRDGLAAIRSLSPSARASRAAASRDWILRGETFAHRASVLDAALRQLL